MGSPRLDSGRDWGPKSPTPDQKRKVPAVKSITHEGCVRPTYHDGKEASEARAFAVQLKGHECTTELALIL